MLMLDTASYVFLRQLTGPKAIAQEHALLVEKCKGFEKNHLRP